VILIKSKKPKNSRKSVVVVQPLEPRVLFSADVPFLIQHEAGDVNNWAMDQSAELQLGVNAAKALNDTDISDRGLAPAPVVDESTPILPVDIDNGDQGIELVVIDHRTPDATELLADLERNASDDTRFKIVMLGADDRGIDVVTETIQQFSNINALHIISHGSDGHVQMGAQVLNEDSLEQYSESIGDWRNGLVTDADILIYGCDVAGSKNGRDFIASLADLTGADVAASDDDTGHVELNADWHLEFIVGEVETEVAFSSDAQQNWLNKLATFNVAEDAIDGTSVGFVTPPSSPTVASILASDSSLIHDATTGKFYKAVGGDFTWADANTSATSTALNGVMGQLVTIQSAQENTLVHGLASSLTTPDDVWIGASDQVTEGSWFWYEDGVQNNSELFWLGDGGGTAQGGQYTNWRNDTGEPNGGFPAEDFGRLE